MASAPTATAVPVTIPRFTIGTLKTLPYTGQRYELVEGFLLVTPPPRSAHQIVITRLLTALAAVLGDPGPAYVVTPGVIERGDSTHFEPDLLVYPSRFPPSTPWKAITDWWLAVEVISPGSRVYDREVKRDAYLQLGTEAVWLVDLDARQVEVWGRGAQRAMLLRDDDVLHWRFPGATTPVVLPLATLFLGIGRQSAVGDE